MSEAKRVPHLVIGSGIAGLTYAIEASKSGPVLLLTKKNRAESNTNYAQGGIASVSSSDDTAGLHAQDTEMAGAGLCHPEAVRVMVEEGPRRVADLIALGARFDREGAALALGMEGGHSRNRIVHAADRTGWECERALLAAAVERPTIEILEHFFVLSLIVFEGRCAGALALDTRTGQVCRFLAGAVFLATGGCGQVYRYTTNPAIATGDGVAMAWRAGAEVANMEFIQFHPTSLAVEGAGSFLISEAVRGEGGVLKNGAGEPFMKRYDSRGDLAPRDIVARAIHSERMARGEPHVYLDVGARGAAFLRGRFPTIYEKCLSVGIDMAREPIPVVPAAHYMCGGVRTDLWGRATIPGLYAGGEVACTGVHGANRLASNSLLEAMVFGYRAAIHAADSLSHSAEPPAGCGESAPDENQAAAEGVAERFADLKENMDRHAGIVRNTAGLVEALERVVQLRAEAEDFARLRTGDVEVAEFSNASLVAEIILRSALARKESRGLHYTTDYPRRDDARFGSDTILSAGELSQGSEGTT